MIAPKSKITAQGQTSVPAEVRKKLGLAPGSILEWIEEGDSVVVKRAGAYTSEDIHKTLFPNGPPKFVADPRKEGVRAYVRRRYGRQRRAGD